MKIYLYGVYDLAVKKFSSFFTAESDDFAVRSFIMSYGRDKKFADLFGSQFVLNRLACIDSDSGAVENLENLTMMTMRDALLAYGGYDDVEVSNAV